jgi:hypothetical protein
MLLKKEYERDKKQFDPAISAKIRKLLYEIEIAAQGHEEGKNVGIKIHSAQIVPFKIIMSILNACTGAGFTNLKFTKYRS